VLSGKGEDYQPIFPLYQGRLNTTTTLFPPHRGRELKGGGEKFPLTSDTGSDVTDDLRILVLNVRDVAFHDECILSCRT